MKSSLHYESMFSNSLEQSQELDENVKKTENISKVKIKCLHIFTRINTNRNWMGQTVIKGYSLFLCPLVVPLIRLKKKISETTATIGWKNTFAI